VFQINKSSLKSVLLLGGATAAAVSLMTPAQAQSSGVETVVVTGSRIPQQGLVSATPVTAVSAQEIKNEGTTNVENLLNNLPSVFADQGSMASNAASGTASVNLRDLAPKRTLVLIDGKRLMPGDPDALSHATGGVADINMIPAALVERVEVETGGASAVYGSDAVAGVVNFILRKDFEGVEIDGQYSIAENGNSHITAADFPINAGTPYPGAPKDVWDGGTGNVSVLLGVNSADGKGNVTLYGSIESQQAILESQRDFSACSSAVNFPSGPGAGGLPSNGFACVGSSTTPRGKFTSVDVGNAVALKVPGYPKGTSVSFGPTTTGAVGPTGPSFNFAPFNYLQRPDTRYNFGAQGHYDISNHVEFYSSVMFMDDHTIAQVAPGGAFQTPFLINCDNPLLSASEQAKLCPVGAPVVNGPPGAVFGPGDPGANATVLVGRRAVESGDRVDDLRHTQYRIVFGVKGDLDNTWSYDIFAQYGLTAYADNQTGYWSSKSLQNALQVVNVAGVPTCKSVINQSDPTCVPINIFTSAPGALTPAMLAYVTTNGVAIGQTEEEVMGGNLVGDLGQWGIQSGWAKSPAAVSLGAEYRQEGLKYEPDRELATGDLGGLGGPRPAQSGQFDVSEYYVEARMPLIQDQPFAEDLTINGAFRYSAYSNVGSTTTFKYGAEWQPIDDFRLRGGFSKSVRAPNTTELFTPQAVILFGGQDPCANNGSTNAPPTASFAPGSFCANTGLTPAQKGTILPCPAGQCSQQIDGSTALKPEASDTWTAGVVFTPSFLENFSLTVDYFNIKVNNAIGTVGAGTILGDCENGILAACALIHRDPTTNTLWTGNGYVINHTANLGFIKTEGVDMEANYQSEIRDLGNDLDMDTGDIGSLSANFVGTYLDEFKTEPAPTSSPFFSGSFDCAGYFGTICGTPAPVWRHKMRVTWDTPWDLSLSVQWRHLSTVHFDFDAGVGGNSGAFDVQDQHIPDYDYFDLSASYQVNPAFEIRGGVNNVFDKDPPLLDSSNLGISSPPFGNGNTYPQVYDALGRVLFLGGTYKW